MFTFDRNPYKTARAASGLTQEQAAEQLPSSVESVRAWENGYRLPDNVTVQKMAQVYATPWLSLMHAQLTTEALAVLPRIDVQPLPLAVIKLIDSILSFSDAHSGRRLLQIAADGAVDDSERQDYERICRQLDGLIASAFAVQFPQICTKKDRLDVGASKRSVVSGRHHANEVSACHYTTDFADRNPLKSEKGGAEG